jgi:hypothetical protein
VLPGSSCRAVVEKLNIIPAKKRMANFFILSEVLLLNKFKIIYLRVKGFPMFFLRCQFL